MKGKFHHWQTLECCKVVNNDKAKTDKANGDVPLIGKLSNKTPFHRKILIVFADNIGLIN